MSQNIDSIRASDEIVTDYKRYLRSLLPIRNASLAAQLTSVIENSPNLHKGPYLEATPAFIRAESLNDLINEGVLPQKFRIFDSPSLPLNRPLYKHQVEAIRKVRAGRNVLVSTGTGSGKTESFLIPILASLADELEKGPLLPGVRALLLYPMNALANDQMKRLRKVLENVPEVTFGRYVGDTKPTLKEAEDIFTDQNPGELRLQNELISREQMQETPPHFLLTNYAMLEFMLLRPDDLELFEGQYAGSWRFLVVDEAHTYDGSRGSEFAMLLRRLKQRVNSNKPLTHIATSATVGAKEQPKKVVDFASNLFDSKFEWNENLISEQDLVTSAFLEVGSKASFTMDAHEYVEALQGGTEFLIELISRKIPNFVDLYEALDCEQNMSEVRRYLASSPHSINELISKLDSSWNLEALSALVDIGSTTTDRGGVPLLSARYHLWLRASEGAFCCLDVNPHVYLARQEVCPTCTNPSYEFGCCTRCGITYIVGSEDQSGTDVRLISRRSLRDEPTWIALDSFSEVEDEDDEIWDEDKPVALDSISICIKCGALCLFDATKCSTCGNYGLRKGRIVKSKSRMLTGCISCGSTSKNQVRLLDSGADASSAVIATSLYQNVPDDEVKANELPGRGRKLLVFSDSRQSAAYFAPYFENTYQRLLERRLIWKSLTNLFAENERPVSLKRLSSEMLMEARHVKLFEKNLDSDEREDLINLWISRELVAFDHRQSLEGLGMVEYSVYFPEEFRFPPAFIQANLSEVDSTLVLTQLLNFTRKQMGISFPSGVDPQNELFSPRLGPIGITEGSSEKKVINWSPRRGSNARLDYLQRVLEKSGSSMDPKEFLKGIWGILQREEEGFLASFRNSRGSVLWQIDHKIIRLSPILEGSSVYRCDVCANIVSINVLDVCPTMRCVGTLSKLDSGDPRTDTSHYRHVYSNLNEVPVKVKEHTAQWEALEAAKIQNDFVIGRTNILSCSTTFELGVDVGELQAVFLKNIPPSTANYVQRAGRAGRRNASAALVVSFAQRRSHDLARFGEPKTTISGQVRPPIVPLGNSRIDRRHAHSVALAYFFKVQYRVGGSQWKNIGDFLASNSDPTPIDLLSDFLQDVPNELKMALQTVLPQNVQVEIGLENGEWVKHFLDALNKVSEEVRHDLDFFENAKDEAASRDSFNEARMMKGVIDTLQKRNLLGYLGSKNILPKYGFPMDVVELRTQNSTTTIGTKLELNRDLASAVFEYAPGNQIVAGGWLWESAGVYKLPKRELVRGFFAQCKICQKFYQALSLDDIPAFCTECQSPIQRRKYLIPEYGFVADRRPQKPSSSPPERSWNGDTYFVSSEQPLEEMLRSKPEAILSWKAFRGEEQRLMSVSTGPGGAGFNICDFCGRGFAAINGNPPQSHKHPWTDRDCNGRTSALSLVHQYETDVLAIELDIFDRDIDKYWSLLYSLIEGAAESLEITRDDIDGTLSFAQGKISLILFDTVPGGAGCVLQVGEELENVLNAAIDKVSKCECGEETSCYSCLRSFRNQLKHDRLSRRASIDMLKSLLGSL